MAVRLGGDMCRVRLAAEVSSAIWSWPSLLMVLFLRALSLEIAAWKVPKSSTTVRLTDQGRPWDLLIIPTGRGWIEVGLSSALMSF